VRRTLLPALLLVSAFGCVRTQATLLNPTLTLRPSCPEAVLLFLSADRVGRPFVEVALLNSTGDNSLTSESGMHDSQRQKAAELGANGIILGETRDAGQAAQVASALFGTPANRRGHAVAIYIAEDSARVHETCSKAHPGT
jgi:hypothetical protein